MDVLKIATAGSVDDGKSTLIGRLLFDTKSLTDDKLEAIERNSKQKGYDYLDFSLATDGLVAEREQGITIDVAHIYFSADERSYIIADTPGHIEYTRNMVTGASTSQASIILVDARHGVIEQTYRHFFINNLLRIKNIIVAVNKMDLVNFSEEIFSKIKSDFEKLIKKSNYKNQSITFIPISALKGDNVVAKSTNTDWYKGETLLNELNKIESNTKISEEKARFPVQTVIRPKTEEFHDFRGYAGKLYGNTLKVGDEVAILPSLKISKIKEIFFFDETFEAAEKGSSITITLEDDINVSRGDMIVKTEEIPRIEKQFTATICWMDEKSLTPRSKYILKHGVNQVTSKIDSIERTINTDFSGVNENITQLNLNDIGTVKIKTNKSLFIDSYKENSNNGAFILIDPQSNHTAGVGFIS